MEIAITNAIGEVMKIGDELVSQIVAARRGVQTNRRVNGQRCFIEFEEDHTLAGDVWRVKISRRNPSGTVYFAELVELVKAGDALEGIYALVNPLRVSMVRRTHALVLAAEQQYSTLSDKHERLAEFMLQIAEDQRLPAEYRKHLASQVHSAYMDLNDSDPRWLRCLSVEAYCESEADPVERERKFAILVEALVEAGLATGTRVVSALGNQAKACMADGQYEKAVGLLRSTSVLGADEWGYLDCLQADCLAELGRYEEAYKLIADFPEKYFSTREAEWSDRVNECLDEPESI